MFNQTFFRRLARSALVIHLLFASITTRAQSAEYSPLPNIWLPSPNPCLNDLQKNDLHDVAEIMKINPLCRLKVITYGSPSQADQQLAWENAKIIILYLVEKEGVNPFNFILDYESEEERYDYYYVRLEWTEDFGRFEWNYTPYTGYQ